nr:immunoglobulin heavy chain junction region [Macaca mulatta]MOW77876.1 immunoglobulin heavy chain junction region [Macaca mulatta]MOW82401.1 immunoglobulin heavy chain junction region [Macaca mulatta]
CTRARGALIPYFDYW